ncbi:MAG: MFS transporter [Anaerolineales bacterium]
MAKGGYRSTLHACWLASASQAIIVNLAPVLFTIFQDSFAVSHERLGRLILVNFCVQMLTDIASVKLVPRLTVRRSMLIAHGALVLGLLLMGTLPFALPSPYVGLLIATVVYAIGGGLIEVLTSPIVDAVPGDAKPSEMSLSHSFYSFGQVATVLLSTVFIRLFGNGHWQLLPLLWAVIPAINLVNFARVPLAPTLDEPAPLPVRRLFSSGLFVCASVLMICAGAAEQTIAQWASLFAERGLRLSKLTGDLLGPMTFAVLMGAGRFWYGVLGKRLNIQRALLACALLTAASYALVVFGQPALSLVGCALSGLAVSLMWPGVLSMTAEAFPTGGTAMFGVLAIFGDVGCSLGPWVAGVVSDASQRSAALARPWAALTALPLFAGQDAEQIGLKSGILVAAIFPLLMVALVAAFGRARHPAVLAEGAAAAESVAAAEAAE